MLNLKKRINLENKLKNIHDLNIKKKLIKDIDKFDSILLNYNQKELAGSKATNTYMFGDFNKFGIYGIHTRFEDLHFFCINIEENDENNLPLILCQFNDITEVINYLNKIDN